MLIIPEFKKKRQGDFEFEASLGFMASSRLLAGDIVNETLLLTDKMVI